MSSGVDGMMTTEDYMPLDWHNRTHEADKLCQRDADSAGLWGHYSALISTKQRQLLNITAEQYRNLPIVNILVSTLHSYTSTTLALFF